jgi:porphobilinogen synthase
MLAVVLLLAEGMSAGPRTRLPSGRAGVAMAAAEIDPVPNPFIERDANGAPWVEQRARPRRNRQSEGVRRMVRENTVTAADFIYPLFIHSESFNVAIPSMPGCERHSLASMVAEAKSAYKVGVKVRRAPRARRAACAL